jgi:hypothetical protein
MDDLNPRMTGREKEPDAKALSTWLGRGAYKRWMRLVHFIDITYPGVFTPEWLFGGKKYGWALRYKKSKSFCTLIPERNQFFVQIVFGKAEREKAQKVLHELGPDVRAAYKKAKTYYDGKWLFAAVERDEVLNDIGKLLAVKRQVKVPKD